MGVAEFQEFETREKLARELASAVAKKLKTAITSREKATLAVSGGNTPKRFFQDLSRQPLGWENVSVTLVDDRWVDCNSDRSNEKLVSETLLKNEAKAARFIPIVPSSDPKDSRDIDTPHGFASTLAPCDVLVLGMGLDGHTASLFPGATLLDVAVDREAKAPLVALTAPGVPEHRVTMTLPVIASAKHLILHIEGAEKRAVFEKALEDGPADDMPIRHVLRHPDATVQVYWAP